MTAAIVATENMRAAHVLKSFTRERIYKVRSRLPFLPPLLTPRADRAIRTALPRRHARRARTTIPQRDLPRPRVRPPPPPPILPHALSNLSHRILRLEETYYRTACIDAMPGKVQRLDEPHMSSSLPPLSFCPANLLAVAKPDLSLAVFAHAIRDCDPVVLPECVVQQSSKERGLIAFAVVRFCGWRRGSSTCCGIVPCGSSYGGGRWS